MFRDLYKQANDDIKGDKSILDKAFIQASQPVKKTKPIIKYSFATTAVAAVIIIGAVFANPQVFNKKIEDLGKPPEVILPTETVEVETLSSANTTEDVVFNNENVTVEKEVEVAPQKQPRTTKPAETNKETTQQSEEANEYIEDKSAEAENNSDENYSIAVTSLYEEDLENNENEEEFPSEEAAGFALWGRRVVEEPTEVLTEDAAENSWNDEDAFYGETSTEEKSASGSSKTAGSFSIEVFSYMQDLSMYAADKSSRTEGFKNTAVSPITSADEAVALAENECTIKYNTITVYYDPAECMWKVLFYTEGEEGGCQCIYMNSDGMTTFIVYGE